MKDGGVMKKVIIILSILCGSIFISEPVQQFIFADTVTNVKTEQQTKLTQEEAKQLLIKYNNEVNYIYQGDASQFDALKEKNLTGYVFLPDVPTDIGYFVNDKTNEIYYFHPSGYLELVNKK